MAYYGIHGTLIRTLGNWHLMEVSIEMAYKLFLLCADEDEKNCCRDCKEFARNFYGTGYRILMEDADTFTILYRAENWYVLNVDKKKFLKAYKRRHGYYPPKSVAIYNA